jgi:hypothetical protein
VNEITQQKLTKLTPFYHSKVESYEVEQYLQNIHNVDAFEDQTIFQSKLSSLLSIFAQPKTQQ